MKKYQLARFLQKFFKHISKQGNKQKNLISALFKYEWKRLQMVAIFIFLSLEYTRNLEIWLLFISHRDWSNCGSTKSSPSVNCLSKLCTNFSLLWLTNKLTLARTLGQLVSERSAKALNHLLLFLSIIRTTKAGVHCFTQEEDAFFCCACVPFQHCYGFYWTSIWIIPFGQHS